MKAVQNITSAADAVFTNELLARTPSLRPRRDDRRESERSLTIAPPASPSSSRIPKTPHWLAAVTPARALEFAINLRTPPPAAGSFFAIVRGHGLEGAGIVGGDVLTILGGRRVPAGSLAAVEIWSEEDVPAVRCVAYVVREGARVRLRFAQRGVRSLVLPRARICVLGRVDRVDRPLSEPVPAGGGAHV